MRARRSLTLRGAALAVALAVAPISASARVGDTVGDLFVGQPDATSDEPNPTGVDASGMALPTGAAFDADGDLFVADLGNNRVLGYRSPFTTDLVADIVVGQPDFASDASNNGGVSASSLSLPAAVAVSATGDLYVADLANNRVLEYDRPFATDTVADFVVGQPDFRSNAPSGASASASSLFHPKDLGLDADGNLWVVDADDNRVLEYDAPVATGDAVADVVLGQPDFASHELNLDVVDASTFRLVAAVAVDSDRGVWVADLANNRVLEFDDPRHSDAVADFVLGQPDFATNAPNSGGAIDASGLNGPLGVRVDPNDNVYVSDASNDRVLTYTAPIVTSDRVADRVFGQPDFATAGQNTGGVSARSLSVPTGLAVDRAGDLAVADVLNHRVVLTQSPTPILSSLRVRKSAATGETELVVRGFGFESGRAVVEVDGVRLSTTRYRGIAGDGTARRLVVSDDDFDALVPRGTPVRVVVLDAETGARSAPIAFTRR